MMFQEGGALLLVDQCDFQSILDSFQLLLKLEYFLRYYLEFILNLDKEKVIRSFFYSHMHYLIFFHSSTSSFFYIRKNGCCQLLRFLLKHEV